MNWQEWRWRDHRTDPYQAIPYSSKGDSFLIALSADDGRTLWRVDRTNRGISYSAPRIREIEHLISRRSPSSPRGPRV
jgi:hypothetical protein